MSESSASSPEAPDAATMLADGTVVIAQAVLPVWNRQLDVIHEQLNSGIGALTEAFAVLHSLHDQLGAEPMDDPVKVRDALASLLPDLQLHTEQALLGLQIGDRLSQMLCVVRGDMQRLIDQMPLLGEAGKASADQWLLELQSRYTMPEQYEVHGGDQAAPPPAPSGVDYF
jgi:hypothetical protein